MQHLANFVGTDTSTPRTDSAKGFVAAYTAKFGKPAGPGLPTASMPRRSLLAYVP